MIRVLQVLLTLLWSASVVLLAHVPLVHLGWSGLDLDTVIYAGLGTFAVWFVLECCYHAILNGRARIAELESLSEYYVELARYAGQCSRHSHQVCDYLRDVLGSKDVEIDRLRTLSEWRSAEIDRLQSLLNHQDDLQFQMLPKGSIFVNPNSSREGKDQ